MSVEVADIKSKVDDPRPKTKAQLKAERRAKQEAQRAAKQQLREQQNKSPAPQKPQAPKAEQSQKIQIQKQNVGQKQKNDEKNNETAASTKVEILSHLKQYNKNSHPTKDLSFSSSPIHPAFVKLGVQYAQEIIVGSNARCAALIFAMKSLVSRYACPKNKELRAHLNYILKPNFNYLEQCRKVSVSMENFMKHIKYFISISDPELSVKEAKEKLMEECDRYFKEYIYLAATAIRNHTIKRIEDGDTILIFNRDSSYHDMYYKGCGLLCAHKKSFNTAIPVRSLGPYMSQLIMKILLDAHRAGKNFRVVVTDSRPDLRGILACERLTEVGIPVSYIYINSLTYVMKEVTKVLLAAEALLANGYVIGPVGTGMICLVAHTFNIPVMVCCETYKFSERVQTDSILFNELADPDDMIGNLQSDVKYYRHSPFLHLVNLVFDATPPRFVSIVITEVAELPCSSAPVILRNRN